MESVSDTSCCRGAVKVVFGGVAKAVGVMTGVAEIVGVGCAVNIVLGVLVSGEVDFGVDGEKALEAELSDLLDVDVEPSPPPETRAFDLGSAREV